MKLNKYIVVILFASLSFSACEGLSDLLSDDPRDAFVGNWNVKEDNTLKSTYYYAVSIEKSLSDSTVVFISNFYAINAIVEAVVTGGNITVPNQTVSGFTIQGYGSISLKGNSIGWSYTVNYNNGSTDPVTATYTK